MLVLGCNYFSTHVEIVFKLTANLQKNVSNEITQ